MGWIAASLAGCCSILQMGVAFELIIRLKRSRASSCAAPCFASPPPKPRLGYLQAHFHARAKRHSQRRRGFYNASCVVHLLYTSAGRHASAARPQPLPLPPHPLLYTGVLMCGCPSTETRRRVVGRGILLGYAISCPTGEAAGTEARGSARGSTRKDESARCRESKSDTHGTQRGSSAACAWIQQLPGLAAVVSVEVFARCRCQCWVLPAPWQTASPMPAA